MTALSPLFAAVLLFWHAANYLFGADPFGGYRGPVPHRRMLARFLFRAAGAGALTLAATGWWPGALLASMVFAGSFLLPIARWLWVPARYMAELEIAANCGFAAAAWLLIQHFDMQLRLGLLRSLAAQDDVAAYAVSAALLIFVVRGGTFVVRGVLDRAGTIPPAAVPLPEDLAAANALDLRRALPVDSVELRHGRLIGSVERLILVLFVAHGQYTALAFFFAAKGLIRFEGRRAARLGRLSDSWISDQLSGRRRRRHAYSGALPRSGALITQNSPPRIRSLHFVDSAQVNNILLTPILSAVHAMASPAAIYRQSGTSSACSHPW